MVRYVSPVSRRIPPVESSSRTSSSSVIKSSERKDDDDDDDDDDNNNECYNDYKDRAYLKYAQKLNNNAAMCIDIGYYKKAVKSLQKALVYHQKQSDESLKHVCSCNGCRADRGIDFTVNSGRNNNITAKCSSQILLAAAQKSRIYDSNDDNSDGDEKSFKVKKRNNSGKENDLATSVFKNISHPNLKKLSKEERVKENSSGGNNSSSKASWSIESEFCEEELARYEEEDNEIYKRPIRVLREGHSMGSTLFVVITYNLALTHHLEVATAYTYRHYNPRPAEKALLFYELTSTNEKRLAFLANNCWDSPLSIRFNTILNSNLTHLILYLPAGSQKTCRTQISSNLNAIDDETDLMSRRSYSSHTQSSSSSSRRRSNSRRSSSGKSVPRSKSRNHREKRHSGGKTPPKRSRSDERKSSSKSVPR